MAEDDTVTTEGIAAGRMLRNPTTTIHVGDSTDGEVQGGDGIVIFDLGSGTDTAGARSNFNIILGMPPICGRSAYYTDRQLADGLLGP